MTSSAQEKRTYYPDKPETVALVCPFCGHAEEAAWDGLFKPRYFTCGQCGEKYIYEPMAERVSILKPAEATCCEDPECREYEALGHCEQ